MYRPSPQRRGEARAQPSAVRWLERNIDLDGRLSIPVLAMHTTGDGEIVPENERAYQQAVAPAGKSNLLRQIFVRRAGHCAFTPAETIAAVKDLLHRLNSGRWGSRATDAHSLNTSAAALEPAYNIFQSTPATVATPPAFVPFSIPAYLRPFTHPNASDDSGAVARVAEAEPGERRRVAP